MTTALPQNRDKRDQCPQCHAITDPDHKSNWQVVACCRCTAQFTRHPRLARILPKAGEVCPDRNDPTH